MSRITASKARAAAPSLTAYAADLKSWKAECDGLERKIKAVSKEGKDTTAPVGKMREIEARKPIPPRVPRILRQDDTPEALTYALAHYWPSAAIISSEAAVVFGAHAMGRESIMRNLGTLNTLWDANPLAIGRRITDSYTVQGARLTMSLQVQGATIREFLRANGGLARGGGFFARFLSRGPSQRRDTDHSVRPPRAGQCSAGFTVG